MRWKGRAVIVALAVFMALSANSTMGAQPAKDITESGIVGPGTVSIATKKDIMMSFGATVRIIPTTESNWDFGMRDSLKTKGFLGGKATGAFFETHINEGGTVRGGYIRSEDKVYFNAMPSDRKWSFYTQLEFDRPLDTDTVDNRGGRADNSNFGMERLNVSLALPYEMRFHAGWDIWGFDIGEAAGMVYADDNPGFWLDGQAGPLSYSIGYFKLAENNYQTSFGKTIGNLKFEGDNKDCEVLGGYVTYKITDKHKVKFFYGYNRIRGVPARDFYTAAWEAARSAAGVSLAKIKDVLGLGSDPTPKPNDPDYPFAYGVTQTVDYGTPETDSHHIGAYYVGSFGPVQMMLEGVYQFGDADNVKNLKHSSYDISAYGLAANVAVDLKDWIGFSLKPQVGVMYTSGDDDPDDDNLEGFTGIDSAQRFSLWGGENTIIGDTNFVLGSVLYGFVPEFYGNGTPIFTGGLINFAGLGNGRGDNPGMTLLSVGLTAAPKKFIIYRTNVNNFWWNEDIKVKSFVYPYGESWVDSGFVGTEWDNELTVALHKNVFVKGQASFFFPGEVIEDVTEALGAKSDDTASRIAAELIWNF